MLDNLNGFLDLSGKPLCDVGDEMYRVPLDSVVGGVVVFDNGRFSKPPPRALGSSLPEAPPPQSPLSASHT